MVKSFDDFMRRPGKPIPLTKQRLMALKFILSETIPMALSGANLAAVLTVKDEVKEAFDRKT